MVSGLILKIQEYFYENIIILLLLPLITFILITVSYGIELQQYLNQNPENNCLYELSTLQKIFRQINVPAQISNIAVNMVIYSYVLFSIWLISFAYTSYQKLKRNNHKLLLLLVEYFVLVFGYYFVIKPGLSIYIQVLGWLFFMLLAIAITVYVLYYNRMKLEKE